jgi:hypothetical protein
MTLRCHGTMIVLTAFRCAVLRSVESTTVHLPLLGDCYHTDVS